ICTAGSVDDGKSTLIGRLLYDSRAVYEDQVRAVQAASRNHAAGPIDFSLFTDGLRAEREQGITIDVAYRYFATARRTFILAGTPFRFPVQLVIRPDHAFRGYAGQIASGRVAVGDELTVWPSGRRSRVTRIVTWDGDLPSAEAPASVTLVLADEIDVSRGDTL